jgi:HEAT repeat protein
MQRILTAILLISLSGCGAAQPKMAGVKWAGALRDPDANVRKKAAFTLGNIGASDPAALPALIGALKDADAGVRCEAILGLLKFGPAASQAIPALAEIQRQDTDDRVRTYAAKALDRVRNN